MARITVEDCLENVENRFELVMVASKRARDIAIKGAEPLVDRENDKATVIALREIAAGLINKSVLTDKPKSRFATQNDANPESSTTETDAA